MGGKQEEKWGNGRETEYNGVGHGEGLEQCVPHALARKARGIEPSLTPNHSPSQASDMLFGQLIFGPPGSGKTTYCDGMSNFLEQLKRPVAVVNLDPANDSLPYTPAIDIRSLVTLEQV